MKITKIAVAAMTVGIIAIANTVHAIDTGTFILDGGRDLGAVVPQAGNWFVPTIKYTEGEKVKQKMLDNFTYPGTFYTDRGFTTNIINGTDPYFYVNWKNPAKLDTLEGVKRKMEGFQISWRKNGSIHWTPAADITEIYLAGYNDPKDSSIIVYPIVNKLTKKTVAYLQYPCGNLICRDTMCSDLRPTPYCGDGIVNKELGEVCDPKDPKTKAYCTSTCGYVATSCSLTTSKTEYATNDCVSVNVTKSKYTTVSGLTAGGKTYESTSCVKFPSAGTFSINATGTDKNSGKTFSCKATSVTIIEKPVCGDGKVQIANKEECDLGKDKNGTTGLGCSTSCKYEKPSCSVNVSATGLFKGNILTSDKIKFSYKGIPSLMDYNGSTLSLGSSVTVNACSNKLSYTVTNPLNPSIKTVCYDTFKASEKAYCGDGKVDTGESCDPADGKTGFACTSSCSLKAPSTCSIEVSDSYFKGETANVGVLKDGYAKIVEITVNGKKITSSSSTFSTLFKDPGTYKITVKTANGLDSKSVNTKTCEKTITVKDAVKCE